MHEEKTPSFWGEPVLLRRTASRRRRMFGFPRLRALLAEHAEERPLGEFLMEELYSFVGEGWKQEDDITLLTLRRSPTRS
jgi:serine phosphatase RsbU (regulator of sigma subunit)